VSSCKELVTLGRAAGGLKDLAALAARRAPPEEFHALLAEAASGDGPATVLVDARNLYETRIGRFEARGAVRLDPHTRQFSDLPEWVDAHAEELRGRRILMYCTGGVRCERASAYVRSKGEGYQDVVQLSGGIQR
jgi:predicted sulfurtransferase